MLTTPPANLRAGLTQFEAAKLLKVSERTLLNWRNAKFGPQPVRDGNRWLYDLGAIEAFNAGAVA
ncbi:MAG TPA: helix-turn-helix domain-containing protein [Sphingomicrobium sp.]